LTLYPETQVKVVKPRYNPGLDLLKLTSRSQRTLVRIFNLIVVYFILYEDTRGAIELLSSNSFDSSLMRPGKQISTIFLARTSQSWGIWHLINDFTFKNKLRFRRKKRFCCSFFLNFDSFQWNFFGDQELQQSFDRVKQLASSGLIVFRFSEIPLATKGSKVWKIDTGLIDTEEQKTE
jgi:hypothetical protein